jgi:hypothetical protein
MAYQHFIIIPSKIRETNVYRVITFERLLEMFLGKKSEKILLPKAGQAG